MLTTGVATGTLLLVGPATLGGCTSPAPAPPEEPDPLEPPAERAESDVALAQAVAAEHPALTVAAVAFAADRQEHASALRAELHRARPDPTPSSSVPPAAQETASTDQDEAQDVFAGMMRAAQDEAAALVATLPGYRAALLASVAACCASHAAVFAINLP